MACKCAYCGWPIFREDEYPAVINESPVARMSAVVEFHHVNVPGRYDFQCVDLPGAVYFVVRPVAEWVSGIPQGEGCFRRYTLVGGAMEFARRFWAGVLSNESVT